MRKSKKLRNVDKNQNSGLEPWEWQEKHSPTTEVKVKLTNKRTMTTCRRRLQDAVIWEMIEENKFGREAIRICRAVHYICWGGRCKTSQLVSTCERGGFETVLSDVEFAEYLIRCKADYLEWVKNCQAHGVNSRAIVDILYFGKTLGEMDRKHSKRHGWAMENLKAGLFLYY